MFQRNIVNNADLQMTSNPFVWERTTTTNSEEEEDFGQTLMTWYCEIEEGEY